MRVRAKVIHSPNSSGVGWIGRMLTAEAHIRSVHHSSPSCPFPSNAGSSHAVHKQHIHSSSSSVICTGYSTLVPPLSGRVAEGRRVRNGAGHSDVVESATPHASMSRDPPTSSDEKEAQRRRCSSYDAMIAHRGGSNCSHSRWDHSRKGALKSLDNGGSPTALWLPSRQQQLAAISRLRKPLSVVTQKKSLMRFVFTSRLRHHRDCRLVL
jgi:hypothetical protein